MSAPATTASAAAEGTTTVVSTAAGGTAGVSTPVSTAATPSTSASGVPAPGSPARNTRAAKSAAAASATATAPVASTSASTSAAGKGSSKGNLHPNEVIVKTALQEAQQLVQSVGAKLADPAASPEELQQHLQAVVYMRRDLPTLDTAGIPQPRKGRYANDATAQNIALQTLEDVLRLQVQNLRRQPVGTAPVASSSASAGATGASTVAGPSTALATSAPAPYAAATAAALAAASTSAATLTGAQGRLLSLAGLPTSTGALPSVSAAATSTLLATTNGLITPTSVVGPAFVGAQNTSTVAALPASLPSLGGSSFGGSVPSLPLATTAGGNPPPAPGVAVGPLAASAPAAAGQTPHFPWIPVPGEMGSGSHFTATCSQGPAYYMSFPPPWNMLPPAEDSHLNTMLKIAPQALPKFSGDRRSYLAWRDTFLPCVHLTNIDVRFKVMLLRTCLEPNSARMREFINSIPGTGPGYRYAITELENRYGGQEAVLMTRQEALQALPLVKEGDFRALEMMQSRLGVFLMEWTNIAGAPITESESLAFYTLLMSKIDSLYTLKYLAWLQHFGLRKGVQSLYQWLATELKNHRTAETFARGRLRTVAAAAAAATRAGGAAAGGSRPLPPQYHHLGWDGGEVGEQQEDIFGYLGEGDGELGEQEEHAFLLRGRQGGKGVSRRPPCPLCKQDHGLGRCAKFIAMAPSERKATLIKERRCYLCFQGGHNVGRCTVSYSCAHCKQRHHTLLHGAEVEKTTTLYTQEEEELDFEAATETLEYGLKATEPEAGRVSLRTLPVLLVNPTNGKRKRVNALLDDGCTTAALVSEGVAAELGLAGPSTWTSTEGVGGKITKYRTILTVVEVCSLGSPFRRKLPAQVMARPAGTYQAVNWGPLCKNFKHLQEVAVLPPEGEGRIDILLGSKCAELLASRAEIVGDENAPVARQTALGWTITGPTQVDASSVPRQAREVVPLEAALFGAPLAQEGNSVVLVPQGGRKGFRLLPSDKQLAHLVQRMLEVEDPGEAEMLSPKEEYIIKTLRQSLAVVEGQYQVSCTWAPSREKPPLNLHLAQARLRNLEKSKAFRDPELRRAYGAVFLDWEEKGIVRRVELDTPQVLHVLPHFPIIKDSESTPVRPVMGCDVALNKFLLPGPNLLNEVVGVLLRFRSGRFTIAGDIKQMFLNIRLVPEDRPYHCFLWNEDSTQVVYQFQRHVFGNAGSPCVAVFVLKEHARKYKDSAPAAVDTLLNSTLIDDVLDSVETEEEAEELLLHVRKIIAQAGMKLAKIHTNSQKVRDSVDPSLMVAGTLDLSAAGLAPALHGLKTLGLAYRPREDEFYFTMATPSADTVWTKREVLKLFPRLFDPLGLLLPFSIRARMYFSVLARSRCSWDEKLPPAATWQEWLQDLQHLAEFRVQRSVRATGPGEAELHVFSDASQGAYAAVAYLVVRQHQAAYSNIVFAKAHVAPSKPLTIPRMELLAAHLALKVRKVALTHLKATITKIVHWSDSLTVLFWLNDDSQRFQAFVYNKLQKIRAATSPTEWRWVPTEQNPADWATRGKDPSFLQLNEMWKIGPPFLRQDESNWPKTPALLRTSEVLKEMKKTEQVFCFRQPEGGPALPLPLERFSTWERALSLLTRLLRWRDKARLHLRLPPLRPPAQRAESILLRVAQTEMREGLQAASVTRGWRKQFGLDQLDPYLDEGGLLRGRGRLSQAKELPRDAREPIILPPAHRVTKLLVQHVHAKQLLHAGGVSYTLNRLRARFWLPRGRQLVFSVVSTCVACKKRLCKPLAQPVGDLPSLRFHRRWDKNVRSPSQQ